MKSIRLKNYRCFKDTGNIELKPINLLVGANSSGKSSILKFFPLLKQSSRIRLNGAFLWLGNDVDFKDFNNTVLKGENEIEFEFTINRLPLFKNYYLGRTFLRDVRICFTVVSQNIHFDRITKLSIYYGNTNIKIFYNEDNTTEVIVNDETTKSLKGLRVECQRVDATIPRLYFKYKSNDEQNIDSSYSNYPFIYLDFISNITNKIEGGLSKKRNHRIFEIFPFDYDNFKRGINGINKENVEESVIQTLFRKATIFNINALIDSLNLYLIHFSENIVYIKPLRATIERYYRFQNLDLNEIDSDGSNLPMYLYNLPRLVLEELRTWLRENFELDLDINPLEGHIELLISEKLKDFRNPVDLGFGYTQLLPILVIVWKTIFVDAKKTTNKSRVTMGNTIVIEQPELHLHPRFQRKFGKMLTKMITKCEELDLNVKFVIETHSETILNSLGEDIEDNKIQPKDINVLLVEQTNDGTSKVISTSYTPQGYLEKWPKNFLEDVD